MFSESHILNIRKLLENISRERFVNIHTLIFKKSEKNKKKIKNSFI